MSKHTPGPWIANDYGPPSGIAITTEDGTLLAEVFCQPDIHPSIPERPEAKANAMVMSDAPYLLAACEAARALLDALRLESGVGHILPGPVKELYEATDALLQDAIAKAQSA